MTNIYQQRFEAANKRREALDEERNRLNANLGGLKQARSAIEGRGREYVSSPHPMSDRLATTGIQYANRADRLAANEVNKQIAAGNARLREMVGEYKSLTGQFNAIRDEAGAQNLLRQHGISTPAPTTPRPTPAPTAAPVAAAQPVAAVDRLSPGQDASAEAGSLVAAKPKVYGTANGREITQADVDRLNSNIQVVGGRPEAGAQSAAVPVQRLATRPVAGGGGGGAQGAIIRARDDEKEWASKLDSLIFQHGMNPNTRGKRAALSQLIDARTGLVQQRAQLDNAANVSARGNQADIARTQMEQAGQNQRNEMQMLAAQQMEQMRQAGEAKRMARQPQAPFTTEDGAMWRYDQDGNPMQLKGPDGKPLMAPRPQAQREGLSPKDRLASWEAERKMIYEQLAGNPLGEPWSEEARSALVARAEWLDQQISDARGDAPAAAEITAGAIEQLKKDPSLAKAFDEKYGAGSAAKYLGN